MPDQPNRTPRVHAAVFTVPVERITEEQITELKQKYGLDLKLRSHVAAIDGALAAIADKPEYDRTHPGYDRTYDKVKSTIEFGQFVINPATGTPRTQP